MKNSLRASLAIFLLTLTALAQAPSIPALPATPKRPVTDEYHGVTVTDDYRWLENWDDPEVKQWSAAQNARTREYLDRLPSRPAMNPSGQANPSRRGIQKDLQKPTQLPPFLAPSPKRQNFG